MSVMVNVFVEGPVTAADVADVLSGSAYSADGPRERPGRAGHIGRLSSGAEVVITAAAPGPVERDPVATRLGIRADVDIAVILDDRVDHGEQMRAAVRMVLDDLRRPGTRGAVLLEYDKVWLTWDDQEVVANSATSMADEVAAADPGDVRRALIPWD